MNYKKLTKNLVKWLKLQLKSATAKGFVVGLSGGVDSAVVSVLCKMAVNNNVLGVIMPCYSNPEDLEDALLVAKKFKIKTKVINLESVFDALAKTLDFDKISKKLFVANIKPRLRMLTLYYFANKYNYLVAGTGNKSELTMGYFTKYGDGGVDILPIGNLLKTEVWELAKYLEIPEKVIYKPPSAGLWEGQTDEKEMGIKYKNLDETIVNLEKNNISNCDKKILAKINSAIKK
ncbi:MAG: NAD+ synthase, partial [Endomicrobiia bacterium]